MPHILISDIDNPPYAYGTTIIEVLCRDKSFKSHGMYGIDKDGCQTEYTNGSNVTHYLIKDCSSEEFSEAMNRNSDTIKKAVNFRTIEDRFLEMKPLTMGAWPRNKVNLPEVVKAPLASSVAPSLRLSEIGLKS